MLRLQFSRGLFTSSLILLQNSTNSSKASFTQLSGSLNAASTSPAKPRPANPLTFSDEEEFIMSATKPTTSTPKTDSIEGETAPSSTSCQKPSAAFSFLKSSPSPISSKGSEASSNQTTSNNNNGQSAAPAKKTTAEEAIKQHIQQRMPAAVASMSDAEFDENIKVLKQIASKSARSFAVFIFGILALGYARRVKAKQQLAEAAEEEEKTRKNKVNSADCDDEEAWKDLPAAERYLKEMRSLGFDVDGQNKEREEMKKKKTETLRAVLDELKIEGEEQKVQEGKVVEKK